MCKKKVTRNDLRILKARSVYSELELNIHRIDSVKTWAQLTGVSRSWLYKAMNDSYGKNPKLLVREKRFEKMINILKNDPEATGYFVAAEAGLQDEQALYKFLSRYYKTSLTRMRVEVIKSGLKELRNQDLKKNK